MIWFKKLYSNETTFYRLDRVLSIGFPPETPLTPGKHDVDKWPAGVVAKLYFENRDEVDLTESEWTTVRDALEWKGVLH